MAMMVDSPNSTAPSMTSAPQSPLCSGSERIDCLFATELGEFRVWHLILITVFVVVVALAVVCKVIRCRRWPVAKKQEILVSDDIRLEEIEGCDNREQQQQQQQQQVPADSTTLPLTSTTEQRGASPQESPHPLPHGGVVTTEEVHEQLEAEAGFTPQPVEVQVEMSEVPQLPVQFQPVQHYQLSQPLYDSSMEGPMSLGLLDDDRNVLSLPTTAFYYSNLPGDGSGGAEEKYPRRSSFRRHVVKGHSFHFEKPHVSFRLDRERAARPDPPQPEGEDTGELPNASHPLSLQHTEGVAPFPVPVPAYQRYGSYHGLTYPSPTRGHDQGGARSRGTDDAEETAGPGAVLSATEV